MRLTKHASDRIQQRCIPPLVIDLLKEFGSSEPAGGGTVKLFFDKNARRRLKTYAGAIADKLNEHLDIYVLIDTDDKIITTAHRTKRIYRH